MQDIWADIATVLIDEETLQTRIRAMAAQIEADYACLLYTSPSPRDS